ncbi:hypothetical protein CYMTET_8272 [Cymbomonas tetramitiformis]|uniref:Uncharacterized protein n=1 Tax=Cymbomonas tetramitiformis TaxID=36881 RepID=A0AAE0LGM6_9CHLO|nr:hypothetical protein CYMTET_8272 [Cymbomonas tetramitiformis]
MYPNKLTPGGVETMVICILHEPKCIVKKFIKKLYQRCVDDKLESAFLEFFERIDVKITPCEKEKTKNNYKKLVCRWDYDQMIKSLQKYEDAVGIVAGTLNEAERYWLHKIWGSFLQKNKLQQQETLSDEERILCARYATDVLIAIDQAWEEKDQSLYLSMLPYMLDFNPSPALPEYWEDGHSNDGSLDVDPMTRPFTLKDCTGEQLERSQRDQNEMFTSNGGGRWQRPSERAPENLWANEVVKDSAELEQILIWQILRMDEIINPQCPALERSRATAYSANHLEVDDVLQIEGLPSWLIQYLNDNKDDGFCVRDRITKEPTQLCVLLKFEEHGLRWKTMAENGYLREELDLIAQAARAVNLSELQVLKWMKTRRNRRAEWASAQEG